ncbi:MAG: hypothetical protein CMF45_08625 [Legionellales bacterium]|nr:hypothetical protein [Legionellales bacterium]|tara:strand:- start:493 stop:795 length:303 start_codon:yes stop_codon:yes gene_type:complete
MMDGLTEYIMAGVGLAISTITFFLKKEAKRLTELEKGLNEAHDSLAKQISSVETQLATNDTRDRERWDRIRADLDAFEKLLEARRQQEIKIWDKIASVKG